jgi:translation initiation factor 2 subunit 2
MSYSERLDIIYNKLDEKKDNYKIRLDLIEIKDRKFFPNAKQIFKSLSRPPDHIIDFMSKEMKCSVNWISSNKNNGLIFSEKKFNQKIITGIIAKYINKFVKCNSCGSTNTKFKLYNKKPGLLCRQCKCTYTFFT